MTKAQNIVRKQRPKQRGTYRQSQLDAGLEKVIQQSIMSVRSRIDNILKSKDNIGSDKNA